MKLITKIIICCMLLSAFWANSQNLDFSIYDATCIQQNTTGSTNLDAFAGGCVSNWRAYRKTPSLFGTATNPNAWMWSFNGNYEAIETDYSFTAGKCYEITFKIKTDNRGDVNISEFGQVLLRAANVQNGTMTTSESIFTGSIGDYLGTSWNTVTVTYKPQSNFGQLVINPLYNGPSVNGSQSSMNIDNITIKENTPIVDFNFEDTTGLVSDTFCEGETILLDGTNSTGEANYFIDAWRRPIGNTGSFQYVSGLGWTPGQLGVVDLTSLFSANNINFEQGYEYEIKVALGNGCIGWLPLTKRFKVIREAALNPDFSFQSYCATDGTITITTTANDTNGTHWWRLYETNTAGSVSDNTTLNFIGAIQGGLNATFTGLSRHNNYYIKHGMWSTCNPWSEVRKPTLNSINWTNRTSEFSITSRSYSNQSATIEVQADSNPVFVNQWWAVFDSVSGNQITPIQCCALDNVTISFNAQLNTKYYIKHGIWNDCMGWKESRTEFWFGQAPSQPEDELIYYSEVNDLYFEASEKYTEGMNNSIQTGSVFEDNIIMKDDIVIDDHLIRKEFVESNNTNDTPVQIYPNPVQSGTDLNILVASNEIIQSILLITLSGEIKEMKYAQSQENVHVPLATDLLKGIYFLRVTKQSGEVVVQQLVVQ